MINRCVARFRSNFESSRLTGWKQVTADRANQQAKEARYSPAKNGMDLQKRPGRRKVF